jgi:hypothetical protein
LPPASQIGVRDTGRAKLKPVVAVGISAKIWRAVQAMKRAMRIGHE